MAEKKIIRPGIKCPDCGKSKLISTLTCEDDDCGCTLNPADGFQIQEQFLSGTGKRYRRVNTGSLLNGYLIRLTLVH